MLPRIPVRANLGAGHIAICGIISSPGSVVVFEADYQERAACCCAEGKKHLLYVPFVCCQVPAALCDLVRLI